MKWRLDTKLMERQFHSAAHSTFRDRFSNAHRSELCVNQRRVKQMSTSNYTSLLGGVAAQRAALSPFLEETRHVLDGLAEKSKLKEQSIYFTDDVH